MKKLAIILIASLSLISCVTIPKTPYMERVFLMGYSYFQEKNFFVTESNSVSFDYDGIGSISVLIRDGYEVVGEKEVGNIHSDDDMYKNKGKVKQKYGEYKVGSVEDAFRLLYQKATEAGANGIINLKTSRTGSEIIVSGMLIRY